MAEKQESNKKWQHRCSHSPIDKNIFNKLSHFLETQRSVNFNNAYQNKLDITTLETNLLKTKNKYTTNTENLLDHGPKATKKSRHIYRTLDYSLQRSK